MFHKNNPKGFTLIEMLVVIAIIAVLVSIVIPTVSDATQRANAATDAANLRTVLGMLNVDVFNGQKSVQDVIDDSPNPTSKMDPDAVLCAIYETPGFIDVYYVNGDKYYGLEYLSVFADKGPEAAEAVGTSIPSIEGDWYTVEDAG